MGDENFYLGADYGLDPGYGMTLQGEYGNFTGYRLDAGDIGYPTDPTTANQLDVTSKKFSTGAKTVEVSGLGIMGGGGAMSHLDKIPKQQFEEINRLRKLVGADLTFHGPLIEPTGISKQGWHDTDRQLAEREAWEAVQRGHNLKPDGNIVITFHSSNGLPEPETKIIDDKTGKPITTGMFLVNERDGRFVPMERPPPKDYFKDEPEKVSIQDEIKRQNEESWDKELQQLSFHAFAGQNIVDRTVKELSKLKDSESNEESSLGENTLKFYKTYIEEPKKAEKFIQDIGKKEGDVLKGQMLELTHGDIYLRDSYNELQKLFNQAYEIAEKNKGNKPKDFQKLEEYRKKIVPVVENLKKDPGRIREFGDTIVEGVTVLRQLEETPERLKPLREFALDKASETFANTAFKSYKKFKDKSPIISIENPPMGSGLARGEDLRDLVKESRDKFVERAVKDLKMSKSQAQKQADKLIGVTWDVGHINMLRKYGYGEKDIVEATKKVAPYVKHVHLSDNFGLEHTELPMGMGNVPTKKHLELIEKYNKQAKKIVETGDWFSRQGGLSQTQTPAIQSLTAFGSPIYAMQMSPSWSQAAGTMSGYYGGMGATNPQIHHSIYGAGYSNLPIELGGQMAGTSRMGGAPME